MGKNTARNRKFETQFDGDEIDGKVYGLGEGVTNLDAPTAEYLLGAGRLAEVDDERFAKITDSSGDADDVEVDDEVDDEFDKKAATAFTDGDIPADLVNADATGDDKLIARKELDAIAKKETVETSSSMDKADVARAIMAKRLRDAG